jgi:hypothetical protein
VTGLPGGAIDLEKGEILFELAISNGQSLSCIARMGPISQVIGGLARMRLTLEAHLRSQNAIEISPAEQVAQSLIHKERWSDNVMMVLTTPEGVPYTFALPCQIAAEIADQLKTESAIPTQTGTT